MDRGVALVSQSSNIVINLTMQARALPVRLAGAVPRAFGQAYCVRQARALRSLTPARVAGDVAAVPACR